MMQTRHQTATVFIGPGTRSVPRRGLTLAECILALAVLPLAVTAIAYAVTAGQMQSAEALRRSRSAMLAEALMEEILSKPFSDPDGTEAGETRTTFDDADDYHHLSEDSGGLRDAAGMLYPAEFQRFSRTATVTAGAATLNGLGPTVTGQQITVTVRDSNGTVTALSRFRVQS